MAYTLRGRLETRLAVAILPLIAAAVLAAGLEAWWPLELAGLMLAVGVALDVLVYHRLLPYQPGWVALPLGLLELAAVMGLAVALDVDAPLAAALGFYAGSWLLAQGIGHAALPVVRLGYAEDGGELGRLGAALAVATLALLSGAGGVAWATRPPTVELAVGVHQGPLVLDRRQTLTGEPGAVVRGGIVVTADGVTVRGLTVVGGEHAITVEGARDVLIEDVRVSGAMLDGIHVRRSQVTIRDCIVQSLRSPYAQGIDISFSADLDPSLVEGCEVFGGQEGIVSNSAHVAVSDNHVSGTTLRGITMTEMSMGSVDGNEVDGALGIGIFCGDYSECEITENTVLGTRPDPSSGDRTRMGYGIVAHYGAKATVEANHVARNAGGGGVAAFLGASLESP